MGVTQTLDIALPAQQEGTPLQVLHAYQPFLTVLHIVGHHAHHAMQGTPFLVLYVYQQFLTVLHTAEHHAHHAIRITTFQHLVLHALLATDTRVPPAGLLLLLVVLQLIRLGQDALAAFQISLLILYLIPLIFPFAYPLMPIAVTLKLSINIPIVLLVRFHLIS